MITPVVDAFKYLTQVCFVLHRFLESLLAHHMLLFSVFFPFLLHDENWFYTKFFICVMKFFSLLVFIFFSLSSWSMTFWNML